MTTTDTLTESQVEHRKALLILDTCKVQEVLINVIEFIGHCNSEKKDAVIISIDYAKAFDTVSIKFMSECYRFFGLGPKFINMLETVGNNRRAAILLDTCTLSRTFDLSTGRHSWAHFR